MKTTASFFALLGAFAIANPMFGQQSAVSTNMGGWHLSLRMPSNEFSLGSAITALLILSNTTSKTANLGHYTAGWGDMPTLPNFGTLKVVRILRDTNEVCAFRLAPGKNGLLPPMIAGKEVTGEVPPQGQISFRFDLQRFWGIGQTGSYRVGFSGTLPSQLEGGRGMEFEMQPLQFNVTSPEPGTRSDSKMNATSP